MRSNYSIGIILLVVTVFLGYWLFSSGVTPDSVEQKTPVVKEESALDMKDDSIVKKDHVNSSGAPSGPADKVPADVNDTDIPKLYGTIITRDNKIAIFDDPQTNSTGTYHINDSLAGFIVSDIQSNKVILLRGDEEIEVGLRDPKDANSDLPSSTTATSHTNIPLRPIPPPRPGNKGIPGMDNQITSEEMVPPEGYAKGLAPTHERFNRRPVHEELTTPLTPPPPIPPTFD